jgi:hypothetical protein
MSRIQPIMRPSLTGTSRLMSMTAPMSLTSITTALWLDEVGLAEATHSFHQLLFVVSAHIAIAPRAIVHMAVVADEATLPHGPPRASLSLRAPPSVFL